MCVCACDGSGGDIFSLGLPPPPQNLHINIPILVSASWRDFSFSLFHRTLHTGMFHGVWRRMYKDTNWTPSPILGSPRSRTPLRSNFHLGKGPTPFRWPLRRPSLLLRSSHFLHSAPFEIVKNQASQESHHSESLEKWPELFQFNTRYITAPLKQSPILMNRK